MSAGGRTLSVEQAGALAERAIGPSGISRVHDLTPLGLVDAPVWAAVTPLAKDLTVHLGKGVNPDEARLSAIFEAIERISAEQISDVRSSRGSALDSKSRQESLACLGLGRYSSSLMDGQWHRAWELLSESEAWVPEAVLTSPSEFDGHLRANTGGLASGGTFLEAVVHAIYELIERDATTRFELTQGFGRIAQPIMTSICSHLPQAVQSLVGAINSSSMRLKLAWHRGVGQVPVAVAYLTDDSLPGLEGAEMTFMGAGASLDGTHAASRAITEACQAHSGFFLGSRETFEGISDDLALPTERPEYLLRRASLLNFPSIRYEPQKSMEFGDLADELQYLLGALRLGGLHRIYVADLTRAEIGVPVARVVMPELAAPWGTSPSEIPLRALAELILA